MPLNDISKYGTVMWKGSVPTKSRPPEFENECDFPYGTTRSAVNRGVEKILDNGMCILKPITFFKPANLRSMPSESPIQNLSTVQNRK